MCWLLLKASRIDSDSHCISSRRCSMFSSNRFGNLDVRVTPATSADFETFGSASDHIYC